MLIMLNILKQPRMQLCLTVAYYGTVSALENAIISIYLRFWSQLSDIFDRSSWSDL